MRRPMRLLLAALFLAITADQIRRGDALIAALSASCATYWLVTWIGEK